jgi:protein-disulfide isomerase
MTKKNPETNNPQGGTRGQRKAAAYAARQRQKRRKTYYTLGMIVVVAAAVVVILLWSSRATTLEVPDVSHYAGLEASMADDGAFILGDPDAPVLMEEFSSFRCTHCSSFSKTVEELIDPYIRDGSLAVKFMPMVSGQLSLLGGAGAICAGQQDPMKFWEMHDVLFSWIDATSYTQSDLEEAAGKLGLDSGELINCMNSEGVMTILQNVSDESTARSVNSTPQIFFNGERPNCGLSDNPDCVGALPYDVVVQDIEQRLAAAETDADTADDASAGGEDAASTDADAAGDGADASADNESSDAEQDAETTENTDETEAEDTDDSGGE